MAEPYKRPLPLSNANLSGCTLTPDSGEDMEWDKSFVDANRPARPPLPGWYDQDLRPPPGGRYASRTNREVCDAFGIDEDFLTILYDTGTLTWLKEGLFITSPEGIEALRKRKRYSGCLQCAVKARLEDGKESQGALWLNETSSKQFALARALGVDRWGRPSYFAKKGLEYDGWTDEQRPLGQREAHIYDRRHRGWRNWNGYLYF